MKSSNNHSSSTYVLFDYRSHQVLCGNIDNVTLGMPGSALSDHTLADAELPHVEEMVGDSLDACCMFKRQAPVPNRPPSAPPNAPDPFKDILADLDGDLCISCSACSSRKHVQMLATAGCYLLLNLEKLTCLVTHFGVCRPLTILKGVLAAGRYTSASAR